MVAVGPYRTAALLGRPGPNYVNTDSPDFLRIQAYFTYDDIYTNVPEAFEVLLRTEDDQLSRRYVPAARTIIEGTNRYFAQGMEWVWTPQPGTEVNEEQQSLYLAQINALFDREELAAKLLSFKRWGLIKGDALLHVTADMSKPEGSRIRITEVEPEHYFTIHDAVDAERVTGCYLVSIVLNDDEEEIVQRIEYRRITTPEQAEAIGLSAGDVGRIYNRYSFWTLTGWDDRESEEDLEAADPPSWATGDAWAAALQGQLLDARIAAIPVYHFRNNRRGRSPFGVSQLQGIETLVAGVTQNLSDEDISIALQGIGVYYTDSGRPRAADGSEADWVIAPASVIELDDGKTFGRVQGVGSVEPIQTHISSLKAEAREATGVPDVAVGKVDVQVAQSGIALEIQFHPMISQIAEKELELAAKLKHFLFDLVNGWLPVAEGLNPIGLDGAVVFGDPLPVNRKEVIEEVVALVTAKIVSIEWAQTYLKQKLGYDFPADMLASLVAEQGQLLDSAGARADEELSGAGAGAI